MEFFRNLGELIQVFLLSITLTGCSSEDSTKKETMRDHPSVEVAQDTVNIGSAKSFSVDLDFENFDLLGKLLVRKKSENSRKLISELVANDLTDPYSFSYTVTADDDEIIQIYFEVFDAQDNSSSSDTLTVDTRTGLIVASTKRIARMTGATLDGELIPNPNQTYTKYNVGGTDLGVFWEMNDGTVGCFFGDTYGSDFRYSTTGGPNGGSWRSNVLAFSNDTDLMDGLSFSSMLADAKGNAKTIIPGAHDTSGTGDWTSIPTAAISVLGTEYVHYMNVLSWDAPGEWTTNFSSMYKSDDTGMSWSRVPEVEFAMDSKFAQMSFAKRDGMIYMIGTKSGRLGPAYLARVSIDDFPNLPKFEYLGPNQQWTTGTESTALPIFPSPVGEISLIYHQDFERWIVLYINHSKNQIVMRSAKQIDGDWSEEQMVASSTTFPMLYGSFMHPKSVTGNDVFFAMSMWQPYNVFLMKTTLQLIE